MNAPGISKAEAIRLMGSVKALQLALGLDTHSAIYMWRDDRPIPERHYLRLRYQIRPDAFNEAGRLIAFGDENPNHDEKTMGVVPKESLRPDVFGPRPDAQGEAA